MTSRIFRRNVWVLLTLLMLGSSTYAQKSLDLHAGAGMGSINNYDAGTSPFHLKGNTIVLNWGASYAWNRYQIETDGRFFNSTLKNLSGNDEALDFNLEFLYRYLDTKSNRFHFYAGGALEGCGDFKSVPALQNAASSINIFGNVCIINMAQWDFAFNRTKTHNWLTAYAKLSLPITGTAYRPGFAYVYDPQGLDEMEGIFAGYEGFTQFFPGCNTNVGLWLNLKNHNRIGLNYRWDYIRTGKNDIWHFDNTFHSVNLTFMFNILSL